MKTICIVPCGKRKIWDDIPNSGPTKARYVYTGSFAKGCRNYAERFYPSSWCILSAKYGFLFPDDIVPDSYNVTFKRKKTNPISIKELSEQVEKKGLGKYEKIVVLGGKEYRQIVRQIFSDKEVHSPLDGSRNMGDMLSKLKYAVNRGIPL
ncbi:MAG: DUF6884 domain-containing protein [Candidatus Hodarchaeota archaeon]